MKTSAPATLSLLATALLAPNAAAQLGWTEISPSRSPDARYGHAMVRNHPSFQPFLFGGTDGSTTFGDTWTFDGADWVEVAGSGPAPRHDHAMAMHHYSDDSMIVFGGRDRTGGLLGDTWIWNGASWARQSTALAPSPRAGHSLARDEFEESEFILFGGRTAAGVNDETWRFVNGAWSRVVTRRSPSPREGHSMIMVNDTASFILFGGHDESKVLDDVWEFDGHEWRELGALPAPRTNQSPVFESLWRRRVMTFGGSDGQAIVETAERATNGAWLTHDTVGAPSARDEAALALGWAGSQPRTILFGGRDPVGAALGDTWQLDALTMPVIENFGQGCGPGAWSHDAGPDLFASHIALIGAEVTVSIYTRTSGRATVLIGEEVAAAPIGCGLLVAPSQTVSIPVEELFPGLASGTLEVAVPFEPSLVGETISLQAVVATGANGDRESISAGLRLTIAE